MGKSTTNQAEANTYGLNESDGGLDTADEGEEEFVAKPVVGDRLREDEIMWRELDEVFQLMEQEERMDEAISDRESPAGEAQWDQQGGFQLVDPEEFILERSSGRSSPTKYALWDQVEVPEPTPQAWEPARPPIPLRMVDNMSEANESEEEAVAEACAADGEASQTPGSDRDVAMCDPRWQHISDNNKTNSNNKSSNNSNNKKCNGNCSNNSNNKKCNGNNANNNSNNKEPNSNNKNCNGNNSNNNSNNMKTNSNNSNNNSHKTKINKWSTENARGRGNGQSKECTRRMSTKLSLESPATWYKHVGKVQQMINNTEPRSTKVRSFKILPGLDRRVPEDAELREHILECIVDEMNEEGKEIRERAMENIKVVQEENRKSYNPNGRSKGNTE
ncbi:dr1-associated corepressor homolog [Drosophila tropicalis]|uniref:dr1-associated corepressor homolog n=1 Tax=Drosophila tropicalis TaxID=46794 RepID=UPI0035ABBD2F